MVSFKLNGGVLPLSVLKRKMLFQKFRFCKYIVRDKQKRYNPVYSIFKPKDTDLISRKNITQNLDSFFKKNKITYQEFYEFVSYFKRNCLTHPNNF